jgi:8-oxo-dGTP diphosphatase
VTRGSRLVVAAAVIQRGGRYLVTRRQTGVHLEGFWEFPGGKCEAGEALDTCLIRELREELAVDASVGDEIFSVEHAYDDRIVELHFLRCTIDAEPAAQLGQQVQWVDRDELARLAFPPADAELIARLTRTAAR